MTATELAIVRRLIDLVHADEDLKHGLEFRDVEDLLDGGTGSIRFVHPMDGQTKFGKELVVATGADADGTELSLALNLDTAGRLFELDIWKVNFAPIIALPSADTLKIAHY